MTRDELIRRWLPVVAIAIVLWLVPVVAPRYLVGILGRVLVFGLAALGLDLIWGYAGQLSLGHATFFGLGAYGAALVLRAGDGPAAGLLAVAVGLLAPVVLAYVMARVLFRGGVVGAYFAIITLLVSLIFEQLANTLIDFTGGLNGLYGMAPLRIGPVEIAGLFPSYYAIVVCSLAGYLLARALVGSPFGRTLDGLRTNERRTSALGYPTAKIRTAVFVIGAAYAGLAGVLYVPLQAFVYPAQLGIMFSTSILVWVVVGGRRSLVGPFLGAFVVTYGQSLLSDRFEQYWLFAVGVFLVVIVATQPRGLIGIADGLRRRLGRGREVA